MPKNNGMLLRCLTQAISLSVALELLFDAVTAVALEAVGGAFSRLAVDLVAAVPAVVIVVAPPPVGDALRFKIKNITSIHKKNVIKK